MELTARTAIKSADVGRKRTKPLPKSGTVQITFRLPVETVKQIDAEAARIAEEHPGLNIERVEVIRMFIAEALTRRRSK
jgi:hypothetical protein